MRWALPLFCASEHNCPKWGAAMKAISQDPGDVNRIPRHLVRIDRSPPGFDSDRLY
jgi:hypothetical protein